MTHFDINNIKLIVYDFDGVMTDNRVLVSEDGKESVFCHRGDGLAISMIKKMGLKQIILSTEENKVVSVRATKLGLNVMQGVEDKAIVLRNYCATNRIQLESVVYVGNDINDFDAIKMVGFSFAPKDAVEDIINIVDVVVEKKGGYGVIREIYKHLLKMKEKG